MAGEVQEGAGSVDGKIEVGDVVLVFQVRDHGEVVIDMADVAREGKAADVGSGNGKREVARGPVGAQVVEADLDVAGVGGGPAADGAAGVQFMKACRAGLKEAAVGANGNNGDAAVGLQ